MALRHRYKRRSWHWMRLHVPKWTVSLGAISKITDEIVRSHNEEMRRVQNEVFIDSVTSNGMAGLYGIVNFPAPMRDYKFRWDTTPITATFELDRENEAGFELLEKMFREDGYNANQEGGTPKPTATGDETEGFRNDGTRTDSGRNDPLRLGSDIA